MWLAHSSVFVFMEQMMCEDAEQLTGEPHSRGRSRVGHATVDSSWTADATSAFARLHQLD
jgi:hypothetical protein